MQNLFCLDKCDSNRQQRLLDDCPPGTQGQSFKDEHDTHRDLSAHLYSDHADPQACCTLEKIKKIRRRRNRSTVYVCSIVEVDRWSLEDIQVTEFTPKPLLILLNHD